MKVFVISLRNLIVGAVVCVVVLVGALILLVKDPASVSSSYQHEESAVTTSGTNPFESPRPSLALDVKQDGTNADVKLITQNFQFEKQGSTEPQEAVHGLGHVHLYLDGTLIGKVYDSEFVLKKLPQGEHELKVELVYPNHLPYQVSQTKVIQVN